MGNLTDPRLKYDYKTREHGTVPLDEKRDRFQWVSEVAYKNVHRIVTRGYDTTELVEAGYGLTDVLFIDFQARIPLVEEDQMLNYVMVCMLEDGLSSPAEHCPDRRERQDPADAVRRFLHPGLRARLRRLPGAREDDGRHPGPPEKRRQAAGRGG